MTDQKPESPQDAEATQAVDTGSTQHLPAQGLGSAAWTTWVPASEHRSAAPAPEPWSPPEVGTPWTAPPVPTTTYPPAAASLAPTRRPVTYLPPPSGPNWGLVVVGLVFGLVGAGVVANQVAGFQVSSLTDLGPSVLVIAGLACALLGLAGIVTRRRRG
jgi:LPXTG-motif cell wall-anchored protein